MVGHLDGRGAEIDDATESGISVEAENIRGDTDPTHPPVTEGGMPAADAQRRAVQRQVAARILALDFGGERRPLRRLRQPWLGATGAEAERWCGPRPGHGDAAAITASDRATRPLPDGVVEDVLGEILDLGESELVALVDVGTTGKRELEQGGGTGAPESRSRFVGTDPAGAAAWLWSRP